MSDQSRLTVEDYLKLPYTIEAVKDEGEAYSGWFARVVELPGCMTQADTFAELSEMIQEAMAAWIETALEDGEAISSVGAGGIEDKIIYCYIAG